MNTKLKLKRGKTILVRASIVDDLEAPVDLTAYSSLMVNIWADAIQKVILQPKVNITGEFNNEIQFLWPADDQRIGRHTIEVIIKNQDGDTWSYDWHGDDGIEIVPHTCLESGLKDEDTLEVYNIIELHGSVGVEVYTKPATGIPKSDLAQDVQDSLELADSAYQLPGTGIPKSDLAQGVQDSLGLADSAIQTETDPVFSASPAAGIQSSDINAWDAKYDKPSGGIPKADLAQGVQDSLGLADTAIQTETDPVFSASPAAGIQSSDINAWDAKYDKPGTGIPKADLAQGVQDSLGAADSAYQKPSGGIPATDMTSSVQTLLELVDDIGLSVVDGKLCISYNA